MYKFRIRRLMGLKPPYYKTRHKLKSAIAAGKLSELDSFKSNMPKLNEIAGWNSWFDGGDWVELVAHAEKQNMALHSVGDFIRLLEYLDSEYET